MTGEEWQWTENKGNYKKRKMKITLYMNIYMECQMCM